MNSDEVQSTQSYAYEPAEYVVEKENCWIVAGNVREFDEYVKKKRNQYAIMRQECPYDYRYVNSVDSLRGHAVTKGFYIGTWRNRTDLEQIKEMIAIQKAYKVVKSNPLTQAPILQAAEEFKQAIAASMDIDEEVLKSLAKKINGGILNGSSTS